MYFSCCLFYLQALRKSKIEPVASTLQAAFLTYSDEKVFIYSYYYEKRDNCSKCRNSRCQRSYHE